MTERLGPVEDSCVPESPLVPPQSYWYLPQGNNIMLVASQPALQGSERKSFEIIFREVRGARQYRV